MLYVLISFSNMYYVVTRLSLLLSVTSLFYFFSYTNLFIALGVLAACFVDVDRIVFKDPTIVNKKSKGYKEYTKFCYDNELTIGSIKSIEGFINLYSTNIVFRVEEVKLWTSMFRSLPFPPFKASKLYYLYCNGDKVFVYTSISNAKRGVFQSIINLINKGQIKI